MKAFITLDFYPRSPRGERRGQCLECRLNYAKFLSTLPARGATGSNSAIQLSDAQFLSTLPARGATAGNVDYAQVAALISIHAPREGSD